jgi:cytochrome c oxidase assembly protein subunit 15
VTNTVLQDDPAVTRAVHPWLRRALVANLVVEVMIVVTGGIVRLTRSGLGCPTWPRCTPESFVPVADQAEGFHRFIEYGNRLLTGVVSIAALAVVVAVWRLAPERPKLKRLAFLPLVGVGIQAVVGGITVLARLNPLVVSLHFLASMVLVALSTYLLVRAAEGDAPPRPVVRREVGWVARAVTTLACVVLVLGTVVTGTGPHSGDRDVHRYPFDPRSISWLHADAVMLYVGLVVAVWLAVRLSGNAHSSRAWLVLLGVTLAQGVIGYVQYFTALPEALVATHMLGASLLVVALTRAMLALRDRSQLH